ncbi:MAG TPA: hypothetical protein VGN83_16605 [Falsiroseomonas sp.]|jgi:hypothetical protein|nr:hypothetical protein [Falsiroseomonas sp.]
MTPVDPAATVLARFGGSGPLAQLLRLDRSAVHRWALPKQRGGSGGLIPARHHQRLLALAAEQGIALTAADLVGAPPAAGQSPEPRADDG